MTGEVVVSVEGARGCGYRHTGPDGFGLYLVGSGPGEGCERLPFPLVTCPCCGVGIKHTRGMQRINPVRLFDPEIEPRCSTSSAPDHRHGDCPMCFPRALPSSWMMWVGRAHYSVASFMTEAAERGISKRIKSLPHGFVPGKSWVYLAHLDAVEPWNKNHPNGGVPESTDPVPGVFRVFVPTLDVVVDTTDWDKVPDYAKKLAERYGENCRVVKVEHGDEKQAKMERVLFGPNDEDDA